MPLLGLALRSRGWELAVNSVVVSVMCRTSVEPGRRLGQAGVGFLRSVPRSRSISSPLNEMTMCAWPPSASM